MVRVCVIVHQYYGAHARVRRLAEALADAGAEVDVLCLHDPKAQSESRKGNVRLVGVRLKRGERNFRRYVIEYPLAFLMFTYRLVLLYARNRYQVIQVHNMPDYLVFTALIPKVFGAKLILDICDPMPEFYMSKYGQFSNNVFLWLLRAQERLSVMFADAVTVANANFRDNLVRRGVPAAKITVLDYLPDPEIFDRRKYEAEHARGSEQFTLIYPGTIAPRYGLDIPVRALPRLVERIPQLRLVIIGPLTETAQELETLAERLGVASFVQIRPRVPIEEVPGQIARADVGIYTAVAGPHMNLAVPLKVLEYAVMGIPIIATKLEVLDNMFPDSAIMFFDSGDVDGFADCVLELYNSPSRRSEMVRHMDETFVQSHSWNHERDKYLDLVNRLLGPNGQLGADPLPQDHLVREDS